MPTERLPMTRGKVAGLDRCADERGVIAAAAIDQRGSLRKAIARARGADGAASVDDLRQFKAAVVRVLSRHASAVLIDPEFGLEALAERAAGCGALLAYEQTGYDAAVAGRLPDLLPAWSARRLLAAGANAVKILLYYNPFDDAAINEVKHAFVERVGAECAAEDVPFFLEPIFYEDDPEGELSDVDLARLKPEAVTRYMAEFSRPEYRVDVLKVEVPFNIRHVEGARAFAGPAAYTRADARRLFGEAASAARKPFIYLSAGVSNEVFVETLELAAEAGTPFSGVLCGRATWQEGVPVYAAGGVAALAAWLEDTGVRNITAMNAVLAGAARPWWAIYGGRDRIEVVDAGQRAGASPGR
jgi:tagatose 1,6-diphosphate aldolase